MLCKCNAAIDLLLRNPWYKPIPYILYSGWGVKIGDHRQAPGSGWGRAPPPTEVRMACGGGWTGVRIGPYCMFLSIRLLHAIDLSIPCLLFDSAHVCTTQLRDERLTRTRLDKRNREMFPPPQSPRRREWGEGFLHKTP